MRLGLGLGLGVTSATGAGGPGSYQPWSRSDCVLWCDTSKVSPSTSGGNLVSWADSSATATTIVPGNATAVPVTSADGAYNGLASITTGTGAFLKTNTSLSLGPFTIVTVLKTASVGYVTVHNSDAGIGGYVYTGVSPNMYTSRSIGAQQAVNAAWRAGIISNSVKTSVTLFDGVNHLNSAFRLNGVAEAGSTYPPPNGDLDTSTVSGALYFSANASGGTNLVSTVALVGVFNSYLDTTALASIEAYVRAKFAHY